LNAQIVGRLAVVGMVGLLAGGCSTVEEWISPVEIDPPAELQNIENPVGVEVVWSRDTGGGDEQDLRLVPAYREGRLYTANAAGEVSALDAASGRVEWSVDLDLAASGGPGVGEGLVLLGTSDAEVVALAIESGEQRWLARVSSEVLAAPVAAFGRVVVRTIDGKVIGLDAGTGEQRWQYEREIPILTLRGTSTPVISGTAVLVGMAGGKLVALDITTGALLWEATITVPSGRSELERLADIDGDPLVADGLIYVATYQGEVAALGENSGAVLWRRKFSSYSRMAADSYKVYASDADGVMWALNADNGAARWSQEELRNRQLSDVAVLNDVIAVGDFEGYVHFLSTDDGLLIGRTRVGSKPVRDGMLVAGETLYVQGDAGDLKAIRLRDTR